VSGARGYGARLNRSANQGFCGQVRFTPAASHDNGDCRIARGKRRCNRGGMSGMPEAPLGFRQHGMTQ